ncbi:MAG: histidine phosphatase family protein [Clostridia bacterium]|nr:histidine phosphatase family protein [Clostridia bacterium]
MYVYVIRHGQSRANVGDPENHPFLPAVRDYEEKDPSLTDLGRKQADLAGRRLSGIDFDAILCGPLHRHLETAYGVVRHQKRNKEIEILSDLTETGDEGYGGLPIEISQPLFPGMKIIPCSDPSPTGGPGVIPECDANPVAFRLRGRRLVNYIRERFSSDSSILLVTSCNFGGGILMPALLGLTDRDIDTGKFFEFNNTAISMVHVKDDGRGTAAFVNDVTHLILPDSENIEGYPFSYLGYFAPGGNN